MWLLVARRQRLARLRQLVLLLALSDPWDPHKHIGSRFTYAVGSSTEEDADMEEKTSTHTLRLHLDEPG